MKMKSMEENLGISDAGFRNLSIYSIRNNEKYSGWYILQMNPILYSLNSKPEKTTIWIHENFHLNFLK